MQLRDHARQVLAGDSYSESYFAPSTLPRLKDGELERLGGKTSIATRSSLRTDGILDDLQDFRPQEIPPNASSLNIGAISAEFALNNTSFPANAYRELPVPFVAKTGAHDCVGSIGQGVQYSHDMHAGWRRFIHELGF